jgi:hypothetical protein
LRFAIEETRERDEREITSYVTVTTYRLRLQRYKILKGKGNKTTMSGETSPAAKKARKSIDISAPNDERVGRAARLMLNNPTYSVPQAMLANDFT